LSRFLFNANSLAIDGYITQPFDESIDLPVASVIPTTGGKVTARYDAYRLPAKGDVVLAFDSAESSVETEGDGSGDCSTLLRSRIAGLNVEDRLKADEVIFQCRVTHEIKTRRNVFDTTGSGFVNLTLDGAAFEVRIDNSLSRAASDYDEFKKKFPQPETMGKIVYTLAQNPELKNDEDGFGLYHLKGLGRIYFAEWTAAPYTQSMTMLRLMLGCPAKGKVVIGGGGGNGSFYP
jgi:hypothetical protein